MHLCQSNRDSILRMDEAEITKKFMMMRYSSVEKGNRTKRDVIFRRDLVPELSDEVALLKWLTEMNNKLQNSPENEVMWKTQISKVRAHTHIHTHTFKCR